MNLSTEHKALFSLLRAGLWEREADDLSHSPLTDAQKQAALVGAYASFTMCALAVLAGLALIVIK